MRRALVLSLLPLAACQTSMSTRPMPAAPTTALIGAPYAIPALRFDLTIVRTLTDCEPVEPPTGGGSSLNLEFETEIATKSSQVTGERYVVDYRALSSWSKSTAFKMTLNENQTLKSFNAEADDQGPEIAASLIKTGFTIAKMVSGLPAPAAAPGPAGIPPRTPILRGTCPAALGYVTELSEVLKAQTNTLKEKTKELDGLIVAQFAGTLTEREKERAATLRTETRGLVRSTGEIQKKIDGWKRELSFAETATIEPRHGTSPTSIYFPSRDAAVSARQTAWLKSMFGPQTDAATLAFAAERLGLIVPTITLASGATVECSALGLARCHPEGAPNWSPVRGDAYRPHIPSGGEPAAAPGIVVRLPVQIELRVCQEVGEVSADPRQTPPALRGEAAVRAACEAGDPTIKVLVTDTGAAAQLGPQLVLPLTNGFGQNNKLEATFRTDGSLETVGYGGKGVGTRFASLFGNVADESAAYQAAKQDLSKVEAEAKASEATDALEAQIAVARKQKELIDAQAALNPDPGAATKQAQAALDAKVARLEAEKKIQELEAALQP